MRWLMAMVVLAAGVACGQQAREPASQAGRQASSVKTEGKATPELVEGDKGLAAKYPGDVGIEQDPDVIFVESFEGTVDETCKHWEQASGKPLMAPSDDVPPGSGGKQSLLLTRVGGGTNGYQDGGNLYRRLKNAKGGFGYDQLFFRHYVKFTEGHAPIHHYGAGLLGFWPTTPWPQGGAGERPLGGARWSTQIEPGDFTSWYFYTYWQEMGGSPPRGQTWGNTFEWGVPPRPVARERWLCVEIMVKMNDVGERNGEQAYWLDGKLSRDAAGRVTSYLGQGFPAVGTWTYDKFKPYVAERGIAWDYAAGKGALLAGGGAFPGFAWRSRPELNINGLWLYRYMSKSETGTSKVWWDHVVVARKYIGPLTPVKK